MCLPAVGQGTLAIEARVSDTAIGELLAPLEDPATRLVTEAERALLVQLRGSCHVPIAGHAELRDDGRRIQLHAMVASPTDERLVSAGAERWLEGRTHDARCDEARALGVEVADALIAQGARDLIAEAERGAAERAHRGNGGGSGGGRYKWST
jgi:hydroxymethylbilane synthase